MSVEGPRAFFNHYVTDVFPERQRTASDALTWPGDEWVSDDVRLATWRRLLGRTDPASLGQVVEFGPGSGKYTEMALKFTAAHVRAFEISDAFLDSLNHRCGDFVEAGRLDARLIDWTDNEGLLRACSDIRGRVDLVFAVDVLMMMDFQSALTYLLSSALLLRAGGRLFATFADGASESGWARMLRDLGRHSGFDSAASTRFHWVSRTMLEPALARLGFADLEIVEGPASGLDIARLYVAATLEDPGRAQALAHALTPTGDSTNRLSSEVACA